MILLKLREVRERQGMTQIEVAGKVECSPRTIHNYEKGGKVLARRANAIADALKVKLKDLL